MDINSRLFHELEWPDSPKKTNFTQPEEQAEEKPTEETN
jgi:hypothetical protein